MEAKDTLSCPDVRIIIGIRYHSARLQKASMLCDSLGVSPHWSDSQNRNSSMVGELKAPQTHE